MSDQAGTDQGLALAQGQLTSLDIEASSDDATQNQNKQKNNWLNSPDSYLLRNMNFNVRSGNSEELRVNSKVIANNFILKVTA